MVHSRRAAAVLAAAVAILVVQGGLSTTSGAPKARGRGRAHRADSLLVKFRRSVDAAVADDLARSLGAREVRRFNRPRWMTRAPIDGWRQLRLDRDQDADVIRREIAARPEVEVVEPDYEVSIDEGPQLVPNDPFFPSLWGLHNTGQTGGTPGADIHALQAWNTQTGSNSVVVAVIDTGVAYTHPDLAANMWVNTGEIPGNGIDDDGNGYVDDVYGYDFVNHDGDPFDDHGHGTHVAGTIAGVGNNGVGVVGVNWHARIMALKFLGASGSGSTSDAVSAVLYAANMHAKVMNNSWGGGGFSQALMDAITTANSAGSLFVAAAGNFSDDNDVFPNYPSNYDVPNVVAVAATDHNDALASFSNYGHTTVDLGAPGVNILSTVPTSGGGLSDPSGYRYLNGTSMATPHVSGAAALVFAQFPGITHLQVKDRLLNGVDHVPSLAGITVTGGRLNVLNALETDTVPPAAVTDLSVAATHARSVTLTWSATGDDGLVGTATRYDLRYATFAITAANFASATPVPSPPVPGSPGSYQFIEVKGLQPSTTYYFALRVVDNVGNLSGLSDVATTTTAPVVTVFQDDFTSAGFWTVTGSDGVGGPALWHLSSHRYHSPTSAFYYGREDTLTYATGGTNSGAITSSPISLCGVTEPALSFQHFLQTENLAPYDTARVSVSRDDGLTWIPLYSTALSTTGMVPMTLDLAALESEDIRLRFDFDTVDPYVNNFEGWVVDDVVVTGRPAAGTSIPPKARAGGPYAVLLGQPVNFSGLGSVDCGGGSITGYTWLFGDGSMGTGPTPSHVYAAGGIYDVTLIVTDDEGLSNVAFTTVDVRVPVRWKSFVGANVLGDDLVKIGTAAAWDAGAVSTKSFLGAGNVQFTATDATTYRMCGLSHGNTDATYADIDFAIYLRGDGTLMVYEGGVYRGTFGTYAAGDVFRVGVESGLVTYRRNGVLFFTSPTLPTYPLLVDSSLFSPGAKIGNAVMAGSFAPNQAPVANAGGPYTSVVGVGTTFDGNASSDADGLIVSYAWDFGDGSTGTGQAPFHAYASVGSYTVTLTVTDDEGASASATASVTVTTPPPVVNVVWTQLVGTSAAGNTLMKTSPTSAWDAGAVSTKSLVSGDGYVQFTATQTNTYRMAGLSHGNTDATYLDIDFAIYLRADSQVMVFEGGAYRGTFGTYAAGDVFRVGVESGTVRYRRNGALLYTSAMAPMYPLLVDTSLATTGATIANAGMLGNFGPNVPPVANAGGPYSGVTGAAIVFDGTGSSDANGGIVGYSWDFGDGAVGSGPTPSHAYTSVGSYTVTLTVTDDDGASSSTTASVTVTVPPPVVDVVWTQLVGASASGNTLTKTAASAGWDAGAVSTKSIVSGSGYVQFTATQTSTYRMAGLSHGNSDATYMDIDYAIYLRGDATVMVFEGGVYRGTFGTYAMGDVFRVAVEAGVVRYRRNGALLYASAVAPMYPLLVDTSLLTTGAVIGSTVMAGDFGPNQAPLANTGGPYTGVTGAPVSFDGTASSDANGTIVTYAWDFGDGGTGTGSAPTHTYASIGSYTVTLTVTDDEGAPASATSSVTITTPPPMADVVWTQLMGTSASGNTLTKTSPMFAWDAGAVSTSSIVSGDGFVQFTAAEASTYRMCGLSHGNSDVTYMDIDYAVYLRGDGTYMVFEGGVYRGTFGVYAPGDVFRVSVEAGVVRYRRNGALFYTSGTAPVYPLLVDTSLASMGGTIANAVLAGTIGP